MAEQLVGQGLRRLGPEPQRDLCNRSIQKVLQHQRWDARVGAWRPDDVQPHFREGGITVVAVRVPSVRVKVQLDVGAERSVAGYLDHGIAEVRSRAMIPKAWMKNAQSAPVGKSEVFAAKSLVMPDALEQTFGRQSATVLKHHEGTAASPPCCIKALARGRHGLPVFLPGAREVKQACL